MNDNDYKAIILARYCGQYPPADEKTASLKKTSEDIVMDLRPMADLSTNEVAEFMIANGYTLGFDRDTPVWCMKSSDTLELGEH